MTVADIVVTGIDNCFESSKMVRYTILLIFPAMMCELLAFSAVGWSVSDESSQGLWKHCYNSRNNSLCCQDIEDKFDDIPGIYFICLSLYLHSADLPHGLCSDRKKVQHTTFSKQ